MIGNIISINKLRLNIDGPGITTLIGMYGCPLNCEYCINNPITTYERYTVEELFKNVFPHALYYEATGGGICFGGHEPLLQQEFIIEFIKYLKNNSLDWKVGIESSLNVNINPELINYLDFIIVDIKDINNEIYQKYTETDNFKLLENLKLILCCANLDIKLRLPLIPGYNNKENIEESKKYLLNLGFKKEQFDVFEYKISLED